MCIDFYDAQQFVMPLGKYKGRQFYDIAGDDDGLRYLDWLVGQDWVNGKLKIALESYLKDPAIAKDLKFLLDED